MLLSFMRIFLFSSWASLFFIPRKSLKRFLPVSILASLLTLIIVFVGTHYDFWKFKGGSKTKIITLLSIVLGAFPVGAFWIFRFTFGKFWLYILTNLIQNLIYAFPIITFFEKINFIKYVRFTRFHHLLVSMTISLILYGFQLLIGDSNSE
ncbi:hypothetical protein PZE06_17985 [Robertmurraya sp. DFI.2.37]|uniref:hypothetical protein n=1 Tax=Robertmurraya sp. DFI.2.37 TaxID=3031819 RepID=UPI0023DA1FAF|nr:hypothetical protein [Robertmurraya sp. DFI.2.37]MDF1510031.1 hypothetical protein [Robertmurraya sp. DFI.2.37]